MLRMAVIDEHSALWQSADPRGSIRSARALYIFIHQVQLERGEFECSLLIEDAHPDVLVHFSM